MYVYIKSSANSWAVGFFTNAGERWNHESDHFSVESAQKQVAYLNGVSALKTNDDIVGCISSLKRKLEEVEVERDALRELNEKILEKLWTCRSAIYYEGGNVDELDKFLAEAKNINSSAK